VSIPAGHASSVTCFILSDTVGEIGFAEHDPDFKILIGGKALIGQVLFL
jgi:hypothetical protein